MKTFLSLLFTCLIATACGGDSSAARHEEEEVAPPETSAPALTTEDGQEVEGAPEVEGRVMPAGPEVEDHAGQTPAPAPPDTPTSNRPAAEPPVSSSRPTDQAPREARQSPLASRYTLETVDGKSLPVVTDSRPGCQIEVLSGHLGFVDSRRFTISTVTRETCEGRVTAEDVWEASGTVKVTGAALHFEGSSGENFGAADGVLSGTGITIESFTHESGVEPVKWTFEKG